MKVLKVEQREDKRMYLEIEIDSTQFEEAMERSYKKNVKQINIPGFRKGKAPRKIIEERISRIRASSIEASVIQLPSTETVPALRCTSQPSERRILIVQPISLSSGQLCITHGAPTATHAASIGSALFLAP